MSADYDPVGGWYIEDWLTAAEAAEVATKWRRWLTAGASAVTVSTIRSWVARGHLKVTGLDERGTQLFKRKDLARAEHATRGRALRLAGLPEDLLQRRIQAARAAQDRDEKQEG
ncbi:hypothetical protein [Streptomyces sp. DH37]|uniref:hypothetical protein n=1 Tax=Streptomyces sp. DH37 TaxID=3040122 RepID=UPI0024419A20|nr:hypothetical protein [Streptomyces sp. DH37]MDG9705568.1 hypothetical protein [Streptomyces sp. DH37]